MTEEYPGLTVDLPAKLDPEAGFYIREKIAYEG